MEKHNVFFQPEGRSVEVLEGSTIMEAIQCGGIGFDFPCGGGSKCGKCKVQVLGGSIKVSEMERRFLNDKEIEEGVHLACFTKVYSDVTVGISSIHSAQHKILLSATERTIEIDPLISKQYLEVKKPTLGDGRSEWNRLVSSLWKDVNLENRVTEKEIPLLQKLPQMLRSNDYHLTSVIYDREICDIEEGDTTGKLLGMAFDIGTTTIVGYLMDLSTGKEIHVVSTINPQVKFGADLITRSNYATREEEGFKHLQDVVIEAMNELIGEAVKKAGASNKDVYLTAVVGNTCMHHLFLGLTPKYISQAPYIPTISETMAISATSFSLDMNTAGKILVLPNIAGFVGADTVGVLLATEMRESSDIKLMIDIGTNGEIALGSKDKLVACSAAAGPAFEGAQISSGMRGASGAIDHVFFEDELSYTVIGEDKPKGICGSGLLDLVAGLVKLGIIDKRGRFLPAEKITNPEAEKFISNIIEYRGKKAFLLVEEAFAFYGSPIVITQDDIRQLQMAKGAIAAGIKILMEKSNVRLEDIKEVLLAGSFGNYLNPSSACIIGLIPEVLEDRIKMVGNAAGVGAKLALLSKTEYKKAEGIAKAVEFIELASDTKFSATFAKSTYF